MKIYISQPTAVRELNINSSTIIKDNITVMLSLFLIHWALKYLFLLKYEFIN